MSDPLPLTSEQALRRGLFESMSQLGWTARPDGFIDYYNRGWYEYTGTTYEQMEGWGWQSVHDPRHLPQVVREWKRIIEAGEPGELLFPLRRWDGAFRWFLTRVHPFRDETGTLVRWVGINTDIHDLRVAQEELQAQRQGLADRARQSQFTASVGVALTSGQSLPVQLNRCCEAMVELGAAFGRIWTHNEADGVLELQASAGSYTHLDGPHSRVPVGTLKIGLIAAERRPHLTNAVGTDPRVSDHAWALREGLTAFAGYPLMLGDRLVGVMALFARQALSDDTLQALGTVASQIALAIDRDRTERFREVFIGMLGHDLRSPLGAILMGAQVLSLDSGMSELPKKIAERMASSAARMSRMVDQLLDYARARAGGGIPVVPVSADIFAIGRDAIQEFEQANADRKFHMAVSGEGDGEWDVDRVAQVFSNLIGNAVAHGHPDEPVRVTLRGEVDRIVVEVANRGVPISQAALPRLFDLFVREDSHTRTGSASGLGLGLFITREIIRAHGGTIAVASSEADGTSFVFSIPRRPASGAGRVAGEHSK